MADAISDVRIFDTTLRDGEQAPGFSMRPAEKLRLARQLDALGVDIIEAGFPIASAADAEAVRAGRRRRPPARSSRRCARCRRADIERAGAGARSRPQRVAHPHLHRHLRPAPRAQAAHDARAVPRRGRRARSRCARSYTDDVEFSAEDATRSDLDFLCRVVEAVIAAGATTINLPDTVGYSHARRDRGVLHAHPRPRAERRQGRLQHALPRRPRPGRRQQPRGRARRRAPGRVHDQRHRRARRQRVARGDRDGARASAPDRAAVRHRHRHAAASSPPASC